jgi:1-acyl-sn-glycerol-3-phosphate acyltransferase
MAKKKKYVKFRHKVVYFILRPIFNVFLSIRYRFKAIIYTPAHKGPHLVLGNHATNYDSFMMAPSFRTPIYFVANEQIFSIKFASAIIKYLVAPISKSKSRSDLGTTKQILSIVKEGGWIGIYPEGNTTNTGETVHMPKGISKLVKLLKIPVLFYQTHGSYLSNPRWGDHLRRGKVVGQVTKTWEYEEYQDLSDEEITNCIHKNLYVNAYEDQANDPILYKYDKPAHFIERVLFVCPKCHAIDKMYSVDNHIFCRSCSLEVELDQYGFFNDAFEDIRTVIDWDNWQKPVVARMIPAYPEDAVFFDESVENVRELKKSTRVKFNKRWGYATLSMSRLGITLKFTKGTWFFGIGDIAEITMQDKNQILIYTKDERTIILRGDKRRSAYKYIVAFQILKSKITGEPTEYLGL